ATFFMEMLDTFAQQGTPEFKRVRVALIETITGFRDAVDKEEAKLVLQARLIGIEMGVAELMLRSVRKIRDKMVKESRKLGTGSAAGKNIRSAATGLDKLVSALEKMHRGAEEGDEKVRAEARAEMQEARELMQAVEAS
ncbi:hypothetical protein KAI87_03875, partial [Myxococcota bacterium]|nr:hypothetical protein [Myxococcota bacterium]